HMFCPMERGGGLPGRMLVTDERVRLQHGLETSGLVPDACQLLEMVSHLPLVPGDQDRLDVGEVLVERRPPEPGPLRDLRHVHPGQPALGHQCGRRVECCLSYGVAVRRDAVVTILWMRSKFTLSKCRFQRTDY